MPWDIRYSLLEEEFRTHKNIVAITGIFKSKPTKYIHINCTLLDLNSQQQQRFEFLMRVEWTIRDDKFRDDKFHSFIYLFVLRFHHS